MPPNTTHVHRGHDSKRRRVCSAGVLATEGGGMVIELNVPTYSGVATFTIAAERDEEGDWRVKIPWPENIENYKTEAPRLDGREVFDGYLYLGSSEETP